MTQKTELRNQLYDRDGKTCHYCGIKETDFLPIWGEFYGGKKRGGTLEVDRKDNNKGYEIDNCVLACAICNMSKSDKFTYEEFKSIGDAINKVWRERKTAHELQT